MNAEELEYANKQADYMRDLMLSGRSKDDALRAAWDERDELQHRAEAAEVRAAQLEAEHAASRADFIAMRDERDDLRRQLAEAQEMIDQVRAEALERFNAVDKDHTMDNNTEAWLLEVAQRFEAYQFEHIDPIDSREAQS